MATTYYKRFRMEVDLDRAVTAGALPESFVALKRHRASIAALREVRECIESLGEMLAKIRPPVHA